jgi:hypothetical protein
MKEDISLYDYYVGQAIIALEPPKEFVGVTETQDSYRDWVVKANRMATELMSEKSRRDMRAQKLSNITPTKEIK